MATLVASSTERRMFPSAGVANVDSETISRFSVALMKKNLIAMLVIVAAMGAPLMPTGSASASAAQMTGYAAGEILVKFRSSVDPTEAETVAGQILPRHTRAAEPLSSRRSLDGEGLYLLRLEPGMSVWDAVKMFGADPRVEYAEPNYLLKPAATTPNDSFFGQMWGLMNPDLAGADIDAIDAWDITTGSSDVVVAVTDTGIDFAHPDLGPNAWVNPGEVPANGIDDDGNGLIDDVNGWNFVDDTNQLFENAGIDLHGTHVSGTIGAAGNNGIGVTGVAWNIKLMGLKFLGSGGGDIAGAVRAINYAVDQRKRGINVRVINASWGPDCGEDAKSKSLRKAIKKAGGAGILFVVAAGNGGCDQFGDDLDATPVFPPAWTTELATLISVAALDRSDNLASYSNYGRSTIDVGAPGGSCDGCLSGILSTSPGGFYRFLHGTSMSTPHVAGIAALLWSHEPSLTPEAVKQRIIDTAVPVLDLASRLVSSGRANAFNALTNTVPSVGAVPGIREVSTNKKFVTADGLGFIDHSSILEVNGVPLSKMKYDATFSVADGTLTRLRAKLGKSGIEATFPTGIPVSVTVFNPSTGLRSDPLMFTRN
jgi:serine protease